MKTFKDLKKGDKLIIKNNPVYKHCDVTINGHNYVTEKVHEDTVVIITDKPKKTTGPRVGECGIPVLEIMVTEDPNKWPYKIHIEYFDNLNLSETEKYKIVQD